MTDTDYIRKIIELEKRISSLEAFLAHKRGEQTREQELINLGREMRERPENFKKVRGKP